METRHGFLGITLLGALLAAPSIVRAAEVTVGTSIDRGYTHRALGVGAILGDPTALVLKLRFDDTHALQFGIGWGLIDPYGQRLTMTLDYVHHFSVFNGNVDRSGLLQPYLGLGGKLGLHNAPYATTFGGRVPIGLAFQLREAPVEFFVEVAPGILLVPGLFATVDGGIGARFYF